MIIYVGTTQNEASSSLLSGFVVQTMENLGKGLGLETLKSPGKCI